MLTEMPPQFRGIMQAQEVPVASDPIAAAGSPGRLIMRDKEACHQSLDLFLS
jgi:hypothetical protein